MRGGYQIINFKNQALTSGESTTIDGIFATVSNPYKKATMISGLTVGDVEYPDFYAPFTENSGNMVSAVVIGGNNITISVTSADAVTVTVE